MFKYINTVLILRSNSILQISISLTLKSTILSILLWFMRFITIISIRITQLSTKHYVVQVFYNIWFHLLLFYSILQNLQLLKNQLTQYGLEFYFTSSYIIIMRSGRLEGNNIKLNNKFFNNFSQQLPHKKFCIILHALIIG